MRTLGLLLACLLPVNFAVAIVNDGNGATEKTERGVNESTDTERREIPLESILTLGPQKSMRNVFHEFPTTATDKATLTKRGVVDDFHQHARAGSSNVFLVAGDDELDALRASVNALVAASPTYRPITLDAPNPPQSKHWLVAYLGTSHSEPLRWSVENVSIKDNAIRLSFRKPLRRIVTADMCPYYFWIPLGRLDAGVYELELYDEDAKSVSMMRRVTVERRL